MVDIDENYLLWTKVRQNSFTFEIDNFSEKEGPIQSPNFLSGGCEWVVVVYPKGYSNDDHLSLYLSVANPGSLRFGWKRRANFSFLLLDQSGKEIYRIPSDPCMLFCAQFSVWGRTMTLPLKKLQAMEKNKLIVKTEVKVIEVVDGNEMLEFSGFQVLFSQVVSVMLFAEHPDLAVNFKPKNNLVKTAYMNLLLGLIETLNKPPHSLSETELSNAQSELMELTEAGFKLDWLKKKIDEISLEWKRESFDGSRVRELEDQIKNLKAELNNEKVKYEVKVLSLGQTVSDLKAERNRIRASLQAWCLLLEEQE